MGFCDKSPENNISNKKLAIAEENSPTLFIDIGKVQNVHLKANIPLIFNDILYKSRTETQINEEFAELKPWLIDFLKKAGHIKFAGVGEEEEKVLKSSQLAINATYFITDPEKFGATSPQMKVLLMWFVNALFMDDIEHSTNVFGSQKNGKSSSTTGESVSQILSDILTGKYTSMDKLSKTYPLVLPILNGIYLMRTAAAELIPDFKENVQYLIQECVNSLEANKILSAEWDSVKEENLSKGTEQTPNSTFESLRELVVGSTFSIEVIALAGGITLTNSIRQNLLFQRLMRLSGSILADFNDLVGLKSDLTNNCINSITYRTKVNKMSLEESFNYSLDKLKKDGNEFKIIAAKLRNLENKRLNEFLSVIETFLHGNMILVSYSKSRYNFEDIKIVEQLMESLSLNEKAATDGKIENTNTRPAAI